MSACPDHPSVELTDWYNVGARNFCPECNNRRCVDCGKKDLGSWMSGLCDGCYRTFARRQDENARQDAYDLAHSIGVEAGRAAALAEIREQGGVEVTGDTSDGFHTFNELYEFRMLYNALLFNEWAEQDKYDVHKSWHHSDGEPCFGGGWFVVCAQLPDGQITNHYEAEHWSLFNLRTRARAAEWDGHTAADVATRLRGALIRGV